jgi:hypothetical protein
LLTKISNRNITSSAKTGALCVKSSRQLKSYLMVCGAAHETFVDARGVWRSYCDYLKSRPKKTPGLSGDSPDS